MKRFKKAKIVLVLCLWSVCGVVSGAFAQGLVTFSFDDGPSSQIDYAVPLLNLYGYRGDFAVLVEGYREWSKWVAYMSTDDVRNLNGQGHTISSHSVNHPDLTALDRGEMVRQITGSKAEIRSDIGPDPQVFVYPYGRFNETISAEVLRAGYIGARGVSRGFNTPETDPYVLLIQLVENTTTADELCGWIDEARRTGTWLIIVFHEISDHLVSYQFNTTPRTLEQGLACTRARNMSVVTLAEGIEAMASGAFGDSYVP